MKKLTEEEREKERKEKILLEEYREAGQVCRSYERLIRTGYALFATYGTLIIGYIHSRPFPQPLLEIIPLAIFAILIGMATLNHDIRMRNYYKSHITRADNIEGELGISLYRNGWKNIQKSKTFKNGYLFQLTLVLFIGYISIYLIVIITYRICMYMCVANNAVPGALC